MMKRFGVYAAFFAAALAVVRVPAQEIEPQYTIPSFDVRFSAGFNYDFLRSPTGVSFRYPMGYFGLNLPIGIGGDLQTIPALSGVVDEMFEEDGQFRRGENFKPNAGASQNANYTIKVDMPMLAGVGSFAYTQNFFMNFSTAIGGASVISAYAPIDTSIDGETQIDLSGYLSLRGALRIPLSLNLAWETMTFGYAYRVAGSDNLIFALNLHRHIFSMDVRAKADIDLLGHLSLKADTKVTTTGGAPLNIKMIDESSDIIDFNSETCNGSALGRYKAEAWTPSIGVKLWRFSLTSRFGVNTRAKGSINGRFAVPKIVDLETGELSKEYDELVNSLSGDNADPKKVLDTISARGGMDGLISKELDSVIYETNESMIWKMPDGHTVAFDIIPNRLSVSYTKLFGEVAMKIENFSRKKFAASDVDNTESVWPDEPLNIDFGLTVDHIMMLHLNFPAFFINLGLCGFDVRSGGDDYILGKLYEENDLEFMRLGKAVMMPIVNGGVTLGTKIQLRVEADLLPLPALRTGVHYYF